MRSGDQCAYPDCGQRLTHQPGPSATTTVVGEMCHIHGRKPGSARWNPELTEEQIRDFSNLIYLCPNHHTIVDKNPDTYTADLLRKWKNDHEIKVAAARIEDAAREPRTEPSVRFPTSLVDREVEAALLSIRQGRLFPDFDTRVRCLRLGTALTKGDYLGGTTAIRCRALAWCARLLSRTDEAETAKEYLRKARHLGPSEEVVIATALIRSHSGEHTVALQALADLDSTMARSAALVVAADRDGPAGAVRWAAHAGVTAVDVDQDGKYLLLGWQMELGDWDAAFAILNAVADKDRAAAPGLCRLAGFAYLLQAVPPDLRATVSQGVPFFTSDFPLAADREALRARSRAWRHLRDAAAAARGLGCALTAATCEEYALWLELLDPGRRNEARMELQIKLQDLGANLRFVRLALQFGMPVDVATVEREIRREIARRGSSTEATAIARLAIALKQETAGAFAEYVDRHRQELAGHVDDRTLGSLEVAALSRAKRFDQARLKLSKLVRGGLDDAEVDRLRDTIARGEGSDTTASLRRRFEETGTLGDLADLVEALSVQGEPKEYCKYCALLFQETRAPDVAERLANALMLAQDNPGLAAFLESNADQVEQSEALQLASSWSLFWQGALPEAREALANFSGKRDQPDYRNLQIQLALSLGDWESALAVVEREYRARERRRGRELLDVAQLASALGAPRVKALASAAAEKAEDEAEFLLALHMLAVKGGWDHEPEAVAWLHRAAELSGPNGPVQAAPLKTIAERIPRWRESRVNVLGKLDAGEIPAFAAAEFLNCGLSDLMMRPAIANLSEQDPRRRCCVPAYSGKRPKVRCETTSRAIFEPTALLTLGYLDLLDQGLDAFDAVEIPHSTLRWLLDERTAASFHQPSQVKDARQVRDLVRDGAVLVARSAGSPDHELASRIGPELASLIAEAETTEPAGTQRLVVRPFPVHRVGSLMDEEVDLSAHYPVLTGCQAVVDSLHQQGLLTEDRYQAAISYLRLQEAPWPQQPDISTPAVLHLDGLAMTYFLRLDVLGVLRDGGFTVYVPEGDVRRVDDLLSYERTSDEVQAILERIRAALRSRIETGQVAVGPFLPLAASYDQPRMRHPTVEAIGLADRADVVVSDDRFGGGYETIGEGDDVALTATTLDLLDTLASTGAISEGDRRRHRTLLRRSGYLFVPVEEDEVLLHLRNADVGDEGVVETAALRAVRENLLLSRMGGCLQLPSEEPWLAATMTAFIGALKAMWKEGLDLADSRAKSDWILEQTDLRGWTHRLPLDGTNRTMDGHRAEQLIRLSLAPPQASATVSAEYWEWVDKRLLKPIQVAEPALYAWLAEQFFLTVSRVADGAAENPVHDDG